MTHHLTQARGPLDSIERFIPGMDVLFVESFFNFFLFH